MSAEIPSFQGLELEDTIAIAQQAPLEHVVQQAGQIDGLGQATVVWSVLGHRMSEVTDVVARQRIIEARANLADVVNGHYGRGRQQG